MLAQAVLSTLNSVKTIKCINRKRCFISKHLCFFVCPILFRAG